VQIELQGLLVIDQPVHKQETTSCGLRPQATHQADASMPMCVLATPAHGVVDDLVGDVSHLHVLMLGLLHQQVHRLVRAATGRGHDDALGLFDRRP